ncbi:PAS domain S-box-containing protein [Pedobacter sp. AK017]|uniref:sensor histidine kinase n=1 Tax=Pedobacter sp. AK017 TaxID=2723073 RepID=UPI0016095C0A|nr:PAS domain S-box protein [Pedobacter sp. AK017]MBB5440224.1 PAS domain S-box-containing protein [Pedobacter sp. AK017]
MNSIGNKHAELITALELAEAKNAMLVAIVDSSYDAIISKDLTGIVTSWNHSAEHIFGYSADEMIGQSIMKLIPDDRKEEEPQILSQLRNGNRIENFETKRVTKSGSLIDVSLTISPVRDLNGKIIGVSKIARDITDKKQQEAQKKDFISLLSHELKTPLTTMHAFIQLALVRSLKNEDKTLSDLLERAKAQTVKMTSMITDFLDLSRIEENRMFINVASFSLNELLDELITESQTVAPAFPIELNCPPLIDVCADRDKIGWVLTNLINNAIKYSKDNSPIKINCKIKGDSVEICVQDKGIGISKDNQKQLFKRFFRVNDTPGNKVNGFGIGLYLVAEIIKLHKSEISVKSELGKGSEFSFTLLLVPQKTIQ